MKRQALASEALRSVGYDAALRTLEVEFSDGQIWQYSPVEIATFKELLAARSVGAYFNERIREQAPFRTRVQ